MSQSIFYHQKESKNLLCPCFNNTMQSREPVVDDSEQLIIKKVRKRKVQPIPAKKIIKTNKKSQKQKDTTEFFSMSPIQKVKNHLRSFTPHEQYKELFLCQRLKHAFEMQRQSEPKPFSLESSYSGRFAEL